MKDAEKKTILVVDDEPDILNILSDFLDVEGFTVCTAKNGELALAQIRERAVDFVVMDMAMPGLNGIEVLEEVKKIRPDLPVVIITAYRDAEKVVDAFRLGAYDLVFKPFDLNYLLKTIKAGIMKESR